MTLDPRTLWDLNRLRTPPLSEPAGEGEVGVRPILYEGELYKGKPSRVFAYLGVPEPSHPAAPRETSLPGMVLVHGGGGTAFREWVAMWNARGYAAIAMDLGGCAADRRPLDGGGPPQSEEAKFAHPEENWPDHWVYHSVANVIRAHSLLRSLPGVDPERIGFTGISWGGYLTCLVSALDPRFKCAVPVYGCGFLQENSIWIDRGSFEQLNEDGRRAWHERCDPSRYVGHATMPLLFSTRPTDEHYRLDSLRQTYSLVPPHLLQLAIRVGLGHSHPHGWSPPEIARFADHHFRGAPALPRAEIAALSSDQRSLTATFTTDRPLAAATLAYTRDAGPWQKRAWHHAPAFPATASHSPSGTLTADLPTGTTACFFT
ncbi:MAG TPA: acetylxylan esterase, partial [Chloroflexota bacterium]|nr:acetylxylan esterase [Chloroflexota bacterium]